METYFWFEGTEYSMPDDESPIIEFPDGRLMLVGMWLESNPPKPSEMTPIARKDVAGRKIAKATRVA